MHYLPDNAMVDIEQVDANRYKCLSCVEWYNRSHEEVTMEGKDELFKHLEWVHGWVKASESGREQIRAQEKARSSKFKVHQM